MYKKTKPFVFICLFVFIAIIFTACGSTNSGTSTTNSVSTSSSSSVGSTASTGSSASTSATGTANPFADKPTAELTVMYYIWSPVPADLQLVNDKLNELLKEKINTTVKLVPIAGSDYLQRMNVMLAGGEKCDVFSTGTGLMYFVQAATGQLKALDDLLPVYGQGIKSEVGDNFLNACRTTDGKIYGVPAFRDYAGQTSFIMRKDLVDKYKIDVSTVKSLKDLEPIFATIKANEPNISPIIPENPNPGDGIYGIGCDIMPDSLGDPRGVLMDHGQNTKVVDLYETPEYKNYVYTLRDWNLKGYIMPDASTNRESAADLMKAGLGFGHFSGAGTVPGNIELISNQYGTQMVAVGLDQSFINSASVTQIMWAIPNNSQNPERALSFLNLTYTDSDVLNMIDFGLEGKHYAKVSDNVINVFPNGLTASNHPYYLNFSWLWGNIYKSYIVQPQPANVWDLGRQQNDSAVVSKAVGFAPDLTSVSAESAAVQDVTMQYRPGLETGSVDPNKILPEFIQKLKDAGIDKIISLKQQQLDAWVATKSSK